MSTVLCIDAATATASVGLVRRAVVQAEILLEQRREHAERMYGAIEQILTQAHCSLAEVDAVVVGLGPGSFIGVRVAVATAKGLSLGRDIPVLGVSTTAAVALSCELAGRVAVALDAKKGQVYAAAYDVDLQLGHAEQVLAPCALDPRPCVERFTSLAPLSALVGDGVTRYADLFAPLSDLPTQMAPPTTRALFALARDRIARTAYDDVDSLIPTYVRRSEAEEKRAQQVTTDP